MNGAARTNEYEDILSLPRPGSGSRAPMPRQDRAAQFASFAALSGYGEAVNETARLTERRVELSDTEKERIDGILVRLLAEGDNTPSALITYFVPDKRKSGGSYASVAGRVRKIDVIKRVLVLEDGLSIPLDELYDIELPE